MQLAVQVGEQAGKIIFCGTLAATDVVHHLRNGALSVNSEAQRSLAKGAGKESTKELLESDRVHSTPRMKSITSFFERVMDRVAHQDNTHGFLGAVQLIVPESFTQAEFHPLRVSEETREGSASLSRYLDALGKARVGTFVARPEHGEAAIHIVDGQGRCVGFHALERSIQTVMEELRKQIKKREKVYESAETELAQLAKLEQHLRRVRNFLSSTRLPFVLYADSIADDGTVIGLPVDAERRAYIEGNAYNAQATKEDVIRYEGFSPVILLLQEIRFEPEYAWMAEENIEEESKSISMNSNKLFTLSTLVQAFARSILGKKEAIREIDDESFRVVAERHEFTREFWRRVSQTFNSVWVPGFSTAGERIQYLRERRDEQNVLFQAVLLQAIGKLGYTLGKLADWDPESSELDRLRALSPEQINYSAQDGSPPDGYNPVWTDALMKPAASGPGEGKRYVFNNVEDSITKTYRVLSGIVGLEPGRTGTDTDEREAA